MANMNRGPDPAPPTIARAMSWGTAETAVRQTIMFSSLNTAVFWSLSHCAPRPPGSSTTPRPPQLASGGWELFDLDAGLGGDRSRGNGVDKGTMILGVLIGIQAGEFGDGPVKTVALPEVRPDGDSVSGAGMRP